VSLGDFGTSHPVWHGNIPETRRPQLYRCERLTKSHVGLQIMQLPTIHSAQAFCYFLLLRFTYSHQQSFTTRSNLRVLLSQKFVFVLYEIS